MLGKFLDNNSHVTELQKDQTPQQRLSYQMFQLTDKDKDVITRQKIVHRMQVSKEDPFMNKPKSVWRGFHKPPTSTIDMMQEL